MGYFTDPNDPDVKRFEVEDKDLFFHYLGDEEYERDEDWALVLPTAEPSWSGCLLRATCLVAAIVFATIGTLNWLWSK